MCHHIPPTGKVFLGWVEKKKWNWLSIKVVHLLIDHSFFLLKIFFHSILARIKFSLSLLSFSLTTLSFLLFFSASFFLSHSVFLTIENLIENKRELEEASYFDRINKTKNWLEFDQKNSHQQTLTLEHDQKFTPTNLNFGTWPKYGWIWTKIY